MLEHGLGLGADVEGLVRWGADRVRDDAGDLSISLTCEKRGFIDMPGEPVTVRTNAHVVGFHPDQRMQIENQARGLDREKLPSFPLEFGGVPEHQMGRIAHQPGEIIEQRGEQGEINFRIIPVDGFAAAAAAVVAALTALGSGEDPDAIGEVTVDEVEFLSGIFSGEGNEIEIMDPPGREDRDRRQLGRLLRNIRSGCRG